jgi:hypothetical protein
LTLKQSPGPDSAGYYLLMSHRPFTESSAEPSPDPPEPDGEQWRVPDAVESSPTSGVSTLSRWATLAAVVIAAITLVLGIVDWFRSASHDGGSPAFTIQQVKDAKTNVCAASVTVHQAVVTNTNLESPPDGDPIGPLVVAASARLALYGGGGYLQERLTREPATPGDLTKAVTSLATTLEDLGINYLAGAPAFTQDQLRQNLDGQMLDVDRLRK